VVQQNESMVAIVTGGGRGIGRAYALLLASRGTRVVVNSSVVESGGESSAARVAREIRVRRGKAIAHVAAVASWRMGERFAVQPRDSGG